MNETYARFEIITVFLLSRNELPPRRAFTQAPHQNAVWAPELNSTLIKAVSSSNESPYQPLHDAHAHNWPRAHDCWEKKGMHVQFILHNARINLGTRGIGNRAQFEPDKSSREFKRKRLSSSSRLSYRITDHKAIIVEEIGGQVHFILGVVQSPTNLGNTRCELPSWIRSG